MAAPENITAAALSGGPARSRRKLCAATPICNGTPPVRGLSVAAMTHELDPVLARIADALERLAPSPPPEPAFAAAQLFRHDPGNGAFHPAPDYPLSLDLLV